MVITEQLTLFKNEVGCGNTQYGGLGEFLHVFFFRSNRYCKVFPKVSRMRLLNYTSVIFFNDKTEVGQM